MALTIEVYPPEAAADGCTATSTFDHVETRTHTSGVTTYTYYRLAKSEAIGWRFKKVVYTIRSKRGMSPPQDVDYSVSSFFDSYFDTVIDNVGDYDDYSTEMIYLRVEFERAVSYGNILYGSSGAIIFGSSGGVLRGG